jgi:hypothetical protein
MAKKFTLIAAWLFIFHGNAQILDMPQVIQEQDQWCWAGVSKSILGYYGQNPQQCEIAEYAREVITWTSYGTTDCCVNPNAGCNYWNYNWGSAGSIQDILVHFGGIQNYGSGTAISLASATNQISNGRPFVVRWGWNAGGGHFVVGHGVSGSNVYYMNPWFGEGLHVSTYDWLKNDGIHVWTHTNILTTNPLASESFVGDDSAMVYPNPVQEALYIKASSAISNLKISNVLGAIVYESADNPSEMTLDVAAYPNGVYLVEITTAQGKLVRKLVKQ